MTPLMVSVIVFVAVAAVVGLVAFVCATTAARRWPGWTCWSASASREDQAADILKKTAFESDKKSLMEMLTPNLPSLQKIFEQADCHIKPGTLFGIGGGLAIFGATVTLTGEGALDLRATRWAGPLRRPLLVAAEQAARTTEEVCLAIAGRPGAGGPGLASRA